MADKQTITEIDKRIGRGREKHAETDKMKQGDRQTDTENDKQTVKRTETARQAEI